MTRIVPIALGLAVLLSGCSAGTTTGSRNTMKLSTSAISGQLPDPCPLPTGTTGTAYNTSVMATGGTTPYSWAVAAGSTLPAGLTLTAGTPSATLSGTPTASGTFSFTLQVTDSEKTPATASNEFTMTIVSPLAITTKSPLPNGTLGTAYSTSITATGGTTPYSWAVAAGSTLPAGLTLTAGTPSATLSGTPTATGTFSFTLQATDSESPAMTASVMFQLTILSPLTITTKSPLPNGTTGTTYSTSITATSGTTSYSWAVAAGSTLPAGLTLTAGTPSATLSGMPTQAGVFTFTLEVTDSESPAVTALATFQLTVVSPLTITTPSPLPNGVSGTAYSTSITATGGTTPYTWSWAAQSGSSLPAGLSIGTSTGTINGTPSATGTFEVTVTVTDSESPAMTASNAFAITIVSPLTITTSKLPDGTLGTAYSPTSITATGGTTPYTWAVAAGSALPAGLMLTSGTASATLSGTPTATGTFSFTLQVTDSGLPALTSSATYLITITESSSVNCTSAFGLLTLCGTYFYQLRGYGGSGGPVAFAGSFVADNAGNIASGIEDLNAATSASGGQTLTITGGSYTMDSSGDGRGVLTLIHSDASSDTFRFALGPPYSQEPQPIEQFDSSGTLASGLLGGGSATTQPFTPIAASTVFALPLEGINGSGQRAGLLGDFQIGANGCDGSAGSFDSLTGENVITNTKGAINAVTFSGSCSPIDTSTGRGTATITINSKGTPFDDTTLNFVYYAVEVPSLPDGEAVFFVETDPIGPNQPILEGSANQVSSPGNFTVDNLNCPCVLAGHATTDGTVTTGSSVGTIIGITSVTPGTSAAVETFSGIEDQNAGGITTLGASVTGAIALDANGVGTITLTVGTTVEPVIHFVIDDNQAETLDESTSVQTGPILSQNGYMDIEYAGSPYLVGAGGGLSNFGLGPQTPLVVGVATPSGDLSGSLSSGAGDVMPGLLAGVAISGTYSIDSTTGRGTGTANLTGGSTSINVVIWVTGYNSFVVLDTQSDDPYLIEFYLQSNGG